VNRDSGCALAHLSGMRGAVARSTEHRAQSTEHRKPMPETMAAEHVPIIRCRARGRPAAAAFRHHSRAQ
jgi:hypothetical protein